MKKAVSFALALITALALSLLPAFAVDDALKEAAANTERPIVYISDLRGSIGEEQTVTLSLANAAGFTSATLVVEYNPYMLEYQGFTRSNDLEQSNIYLEAGAPQVGVKEGDVSHLVFIAITHMEQFPESLDICDIGELSFKVIGGGEYPIAVTADDFAVQGEDTEPLVISGTAYAEGEVASEWHYAEQTYAQMTVGSGYEVVKTRYIPTWLKIAAGVIVVAVIVLVILLIAKGRNVIDDEDEEEPQEVEQ